MDERVNSILSDIISKRQVRVLSIDFDATIIQVHTYGAWRGTSEELSLHVRPVFISLLKSALSLKENGLHVSVVTFSAQAKLIRKVLGHVLGEELARHIIIRCNDLKWEWPQGFEQAGKQGHIGSVLEHILATTQTTIPLGQVMLIDDDTRNIRIAHRAGIRTTVFPVIDLPEKGGAEEKAALEEEGERKVNLFLDELQRACEAEGPWMQSDS